MVTFGTGGNEYGQCGEEPERKDDSSRPLRRDIVIPQRCAPRFSVRQVIKFNGLFSMMGWFGLMYLRLSSYCLC